jgi:hypothetical protein
MRSPRTRSSPLTTPRPITINARTYGDYHTLEEALHRAKAAIVLDPDLDPEIIDRRTGRACMVAASKRWRDEIAERLGA